MIKSAKLCQLRTCRWELAVQNTDIAEKNAVSSKEVASRASREKFLLFFISWGFGATTTSWTLLGSVFSLSTALSIRAFSLSVKS